MIFAGSPEGLSAQEPAPYPLDGPDAVASYEVDLPRFHVFTSNSGYPAFENDLANQSVSNTTRALFQAEGHPLDANSTISIFLSLATLPPPEFPWHIQSGSDRYSVKQTSDGYHVYQAIQMSEPLPQEFTSATYTIH
jgi:hypothetical protein